LFGRTGTGKSAFLAHHFPGDAAFRKHPNKWFDGYELHHTAIIVDEVPADTHLIQHLKMWADRYPVSGEIKGSTVPLMHEWLFVTSQHSIHDLENGRASDRDAILRRFTMAEVVGHSVDFSRVVTSRGNVVTLDLSSKAIVVIDRVDLDINHIDGSYSSRDPDCPYLFPNPASINIDNIL
jgi:hypothetical protein